MFAWNREDLDAVTRALARARAGRPTVLVVEGGPGTGKSCLLDEVVRRASGFTVSSAEGVPGGSFPYSVLTQWGADVPLDVSQTVTGPFLAAQRLRLRLDAHPGPHLLRIEDLAWADPESVEALVWLLRRAMGDQLLVALSTRPLAADTHLGWQRYTAAPDRAVRVALRGLSAAQAVEVALDRRPGMSPAVATALWAHTEGVPLYLTALLEEYEPAELETRRTLPAPASFARAVEARLDRLSPGAVALARGVAVVGSGGWSSLRDVARIADVGPADELAYELHLVGLLDLREGRDGTEVHLSHALTRAAVHDATPLHQRRLLHLAASRLLPEEADRLDHAIAANVEHDEQVAARAEAYAQRLRTQRSHRMAARYFLTASALSPDPDRRRHRRSEGLVEAVMSGQFTFASDELDRAPLGEGETTVLRGLIAVRRNRWREALDVLGPRAWGDSAPTTRYRAEVLLAWALIGNGRTFAEVGACLHRAQDEQVEDLAVAGYAAFARWELAVHSRRLPEVLAGFAFGTTPPVAVAIADTAELAARGAAYAAGGLFAEALADLVEVVSRAQQGLLEMPNGSLLALVGLLHWVHGDLARAGVSLRLAREMPGTSDHPAIFYLSTLTASTEGRFVEVEENMAMAERTLDRMPVAPASVAMVSARAVQLHARGPAGRRAAAQALLPVIRRTLGTAFGVQQAHLVSVSQICLWAEDLDLAAESIDRLDALEIRPEWLDACVGWLRALLAEQHGDLDRAVAEHRSALAAGWSYLRLYEAHSHADLARVQQRLGRHDEASDSLARAREAYLRIGAQAFVDRIDRLQPQLSLLPGPPAAVGLTERERDVLLLALGGMSYRQIAQELFITQKTVGFHLSNLYGKTGVGSRHELADYARRHPQALGLAPDTAPRARPVRSTGTHRRTVPKT